MESNVPTAPLERSRRRMLLALGALPVLASCGGGGGGGGPGDGPRDDDGFRNRYASAQDFTVSQHAASRARDGGVIVIGGSRGQSALSDGIDRFDSATRTFSRIGTLGGGRGSHRATALAGGGILVTGGLRSDGNSRAAELVSDLTGASEAAGAMSVARIDHAAVQLRDGRVLVTGGSSTGERAPLGISSSAEIWDPAQRAFRRLTATMLLPRAAHTVTVLPNGKVLVAGGYTAATPYLFAEIFDPATESFAAVADNAAVRASHADHLMPDGRVLLLGGETLDADGVTPLPLASALAFDPATGRIVPMPSLAAPRTWAATVALGSGDVLLFGGQSQLPGYTATAERYRPTAGGTAIAPLDGERALHTATRLTDGRVAIIGGESSGGSYRSTVQVYE